MDNSSWLIYRGPQASAHTDQKPSGDNNQTVSPPLAALKPPPPWRQFDPTTRERYLGRLFQPDPQLIPIVNMALYLRRPLLITGNPGTGKSSLASSLAEELHSTPLLRWSITSRSTLHEGLYSYDAVRRLQDTQLYMYARSAGQDTGMMNPIKQLGEYIKLGPLGTAMLPAEYPRVLLIDEIDKSDIDLPNDLLNIFEEGFYEIDEIRRHRHSEDAEHVSVRDSQNRPANIPVDGIIRCTAFPIIVMTSNQERDFPPAFLRRCLRYKMPDPEEPELIAIVRAHLGEQVASEHLERIRRFLTERKRLGGNLATDQLLNLIYLVTNDVTASSTIQERAVDLLEWVLLSDLSKGV